MESLVESRAEPSRWRWWLAGVLAGLAGVAASYLAAMLLTVRESPVVAVAELVIRLTPGSLAERAISLVGKADKPLLLGGVVVVSGLLLGWAGLLRRRGLWRATAVHLALGAVATAAVLVQGGRTLAVGAVVIGVAAWIVCLTALTDPLRAWRAEPARAAAERRVFLTVAATLGVAAVAMGAVGRVAGSGRRRVEESRRLLRLVGVSRREAPVGTSVGLRGVAPWRTPNGEFYLIHTALSLPTIDPEQWTLRIHGMVEREVTLTYADLARRTMTEAWVTLTCVSNPVGGDLVGNAWWSGVRVAELLDDLGVSPDADCVLQTSADGWTCTTPLTALTDSRDAMLALAMNGRPLPLEHGFPVRTVVPGLYGYVSATKWLVDLEVTRYDRATAFWTERGWSERGPVKLASRIDVPRDDASVPAGEVRVGGVAWAQHVGVEAVEVSLDGGAWRPAEVAHPDTNDTWVQWAATLEVEPGDHVLAVRATDKHGDVQTGVVRDVVPDGATGWHEVSFSASV